MGKTLAIRAKSGASTHRLLPPVAQRWIVLLYLSDIHRLAKCSTAGGSRHRSRACRRGRQAVMVGHANSRAVDLGRELSLCGDPRLIEFHQTLRTNNGCRQSQRQTCLSQWYASPYSRWCQRRRSASVVYRDGVGTWSAPTPMMKPALLNR